MKLVGTSRWSLEAALSGLAALRWRPGRWRVDVDDDGFVRGRAWRGFPVGAVGQGGFSVDVEGGFGWLFAQGNWMAPLEAWPGLALAVTTTPGSAKRPATRTWPLRRRRRGNDGFDDVALRGERPFFTQRFVDDDAPVDVVVDGFSPLVPHDEAAATLPALGLGVSLRSRVDVDVRARVRLHLDPPIGAGGTGHTGVVVDDAGRLTGLGGRLWWPAVPTSATTATVATAKGPRVALRIDPAVPPPDDARRSAHGAWLALADDDDDSASVDVDARDVLVDVVVPRGASVRSAFVLAWWFPHHIVDARPARQRVDPRGRPQPSTPLVDVGRHAGVPTDGPASVARRMVDDDVAFRAAADAPLSLLRDSSLPAWLARAIANSAAPMVTNTVVPADGVLSTLEGSGWRWWFGGLCGTSDQRLVAHPYSSTFFPRLDKTELQTFLRLTRDGSVPHGTGNPDLVLGDDRVPYGRPLAVAGVLRDEQWPDLTLSWILQACRLARATGDRRWLVEIAPSLVTMLGFLRTLAGEHGVPVGGSTFDTFHFPGTFAYTAGLYAAALHAVADVATTLRRDAAGDDVVDEGPGGHDDDGARIAAALDRAVAEGRAASEGAVAALWDPRGFFRATPTRATLMLGSMAGPWIARWSGLPLPWRGIDVRAHLVWQHRVFFGQPLPRGRRAAFPHTERHPDGTPAVTRALAVLPVFGYAWQVLAYHALAAVQAGLVDEGLDVLRGFVDHTHDRGAPFTADLYGNAGGAVYMSQTALWATPQALTGAFLDALTGTLTLSPRLPRGADVARWPVFLPTTWAMLEVDRVRDRLVLTVTATHGAPATVRALRLVDVDDHAGVRPWPQPVRLDVGVELVVDNAGVR
jgi:hypothetical protein